MSTAEPTRSPSQYSEQEAKRILSRAAEIDAISGSGFTASDLHGIAAAASISPAALERALGEPAQVVPDSRAVQHGGNGARGALARGLGFLCIGAGLGALAVAFDGRPLGPELAAAVFGPSAAFVLYRALRNRWHGTLPDFLREVVLTMGAYTLSITALEGFHATTTALLWSGICSAAGAAVAAVEIRVVARKSSGSYGDAPAKD